MHGTQGIGVISVGAGRGEDVPMDRRAHNARRKPYSKAGRSGRSGRSGRRGEDGEDGEEEGEEGEERGGGRDQQMPQSPERQGGICARSSKATLQTYLDVMYEITA